jgi:hypothetical protein
MIHSKEHGAVSLYILCQHPNGSEKTLKDDSLFLTFILSIELVVVGVSQGNGAQVAT